MGCRASERFRSLSLSLLQRYGVFTLIVCCFSLPLGAQDLSDRNPNAVPIGTVDLRTLPPSPVPAPGAQGAGRGGLDVELGDTGPLLVGPTSATPFGTCPVPCAGGVAELETCSTILNNGCNIVPLNPTNFIAAACGTLYCGEVWATGGVRDSDFYRIEPTQVTTLSADLVSNAPVMLAILADSGADCVNVDIIDVAFSSGDCALTSVSYTVPAGTYYIFIAPDPGDGTGLFNFLPCGGMNNDYEVTINCVAPPCQLTTVGTPEGEPLMTAMNNGCDTMPVVHDTILAGQTIVGTIWADGGSRDSDWYEFTVSGSAATVEATLESEFPARVYLLELGCPVNSLAVATSTACASGGLTTTLAAGTYVLAVLPEDLDLGVLTDGISVTDPANEYALTLGVTGVAPGCTLACSGTPEPDACGFNTDDGCFAGNYIPLAIDGTPTCGDIFATNGIRDIDWYTFGLAVDTPITLNVQSQFPAQIALGTCGATPGVVNLIAQANALDCAATPGVITGTLSAGSYVVVVTSGIGPIGGGELTSGFPCTGGSTGYRISLTTNAPPGGCTLTSTAPAEAETCGQVINNGCNLPTPSFEPIALGDTRSGSVWADGNNRDSDWWEFTLTEPTTVSWTVTGELPLNTFVISGVPDACNTPASIVGGIPSPGDCMPVNSGGFDLPCGTHYLFVAPGDATGAGIYTGFPCMTQNDYEITLTGVPSTACLDPTLSLTADCLAGTIDIEVLVNQCLTAASYRVVDQSGVQVTLQSLAAPLSACDVVPITVGPFVTGGVYEVEVTGDCCGGGMVAVTAEVLLPLYAGQTEIIWNPTPNNPALPAGYEGTIPSEIILRNVLEANPLNRATLTIEDLLGFGCLDEIGPGDTLWATLGSFPDNHALSEDEAQVLIDLMGRGVSIYLEGGDIWGFDLPTSFADYDGVLGRSTTAPDVFNFDGDDSFTTMDGGVHAGLDVSMFTDVIYYEDNTDPMVFGGNDSIDRLNPTQPGQGVDVDIPGSNAGAIWFNSPDGLPDPLVAEGSYATTIYYIPASPCQGRVICSSWRSAAVARVC